jgi:hypothetical protein
MSESDDSPVASTSRNVIGEETAATTIDSDLTKLRQLRLTITQQQHQQFNRQATDQLVSTILSQAGKKNTLTLLSTETDYKQITHP